VGSAFLLGGCELLELGDWFLVAVFGLHSLGAHTVWNKNENRVWEYGSISGRVFAIMFSFGLTKHIVSLGGFLVTSHRRL
jgi:hypothetical protein